MLLNTRDGYELCMAEAKEKEGRMGYDTARYGCISSYKDELKKQVPTLNQIYEGY